MHIIVVALDFNATYADYNHSLTAVLFCRTPARKTCPPAVHLSSQIPPLFERSRGSPKLLISINQTAVHSCRGSSNQSSLKTHPWAITFKQSSPNSGRQTLLIKQWSWHRRWRRRVCKVLLLVSRVAPPPPPAPAARSPRTYMPPCLLACCLLACLLVSAHCFPRWIVFVFWLF